MLHKTSLREGPFMVEMLESRRLLSAALLDQPAASPEAASHADLVPGQDRRQQRAAWLEARYLRNMIDQRFAALSMAQVAMTKAERPELRALAEDLVETYTTDIEELQTWLNEWHGTEHTPELTPRQERQIEQLVSIPAERFDIIFPRLLIRHHRTSIAMSRPLTKLAPHEELRDWAEAAISTHTAAIQEIQTSLREWYGPGSAQQGDNNGHGHGGPFDERPRRGPR